MSDTTARRVFILGCWGIKLLLAPWQFAVNTLGLLVLLAMLVLWFCWKLLTDWPWSWIAALACTAWEWLKSFQFVRQVENPKHSLHAWFTRCREKHGLRRMLATEWRAECRNVLNFRPGKWPWR